MSIIFALLLGSSLFISSCSGKKTWKVSEHDLRRGLAALYNKDPSARGRAATLHLNNQDVEYIIEKATYGIVKLELDQYGLW